MKLKKFFTDIPFLPLPNKSDTKTETMRAIQIGAGSKVFRVDESGLWLGAEKWSDAPFRVDMEGNAVLNSVTLSGYFNKSTDTLDDINDGTTFKRVIETEKIGAGRAYNGLNSDYEIIKGFVNSQLSSKTLPDNGVRIDSNGIYGRKSGTTTFYISNAGDAYFSGTIAASSITGSTVTGGTVQTSSSGARVVMDGSNDYLRIYDSSRERVRLSQAYLYFYNSYGNNVGKIYTSSNTNFYIEAPSGNYLILSAAGSLYTINFRIGGSTIGYWRSSGLKIADGKDISAQFAHLDCVTLANNSPLTEDGTIYYNSSDHHFYGRCNGVWKQLDN